MQKILVTGATGNVGQEVFRLLLSHDCHVCAAVRCSELQTSEAKTANKAILKPH